jgi:iron(III) transport system ATP-binding protein
MSLLELQGLSKRYGAVTALAEATLSVPAGSRTAIVGPSGSGKTTLLRLIAGFDAPDSGRILLGDQLLADGPDAMPAHKRGIGLVSQDGALFPHLSIADNIGFGLPRSAPAMKNGGRAKHIADLMHMVELDLSMARRRPDQLSGGQQQRVALARALACKPRLMLLDEPFSALDTALRAGTRKAVADLLSLAGITTILVTHDQAEALSFADQVAVMNKGRLLQVGAPRELYLRPRDEMIAEFLGDAIVLSALIESGMAECVLGRVAVDDAARSGEGRIMLRPEQIDFVAGPASGGAAGTVGEVTDVDFAGALCTVALRLADGSSLSLRRSSLDVPSIGAKVRIALRGPAHLFAA